MMTGVIGAAAGTAAAAAAGSGADTLAPGSRLGFGDHASDLADDGPRSGEFFFGNRGTEAVPVSRSSTRVAPAPASIPPAPPGKEKRGDRRRRLGIPRRVTLRVVLFVLLIAAVPVGAYLVLRWYAYDNWYVTTKGDHIVVMQGQPGGVLWFHPRLVDTTPYAISQVSTQAAAAIAGKVQEPSVAAARHYVTNNTTTTTTSTIPPTTTTTTLPAAASTATTTTSTVPVTTTSAP
jgi:hypothetical protein